MNLSCFLPYLSLWRSIMKINHTVLALILSIGLPMSTALAEVVGAPAGLIAYQGYLTDEQGNPLGTTEVRDYDVLFALFAEEEGGDPLWAETQSISVSRGYFTALLGEGVPVVTPPASLAQILGSASAAAPYLELAVRLSPQEDFLAMSRRVRLGYAAYAVLAQQAEQLVNEAGETLLSLDSSGVEISNWQIDNDLTVNGRILGNAGTGLTDLASGNINRGTFSVARLPSIPASRIQGRVSSARIASMNASAVTLGTLPFAVVPRTIPASRITSGTIRASDLPNLPASRFTSGTVPAWFLPTSISASTINSGILPVSRGGTGRSFISNDQVVIGNGQNSLSSSLSLRWDPRRAHTRGLRVAGNFGNVRTAWRDNWGGGIATWGLLVNGIRYSSWTSSSDERLKENIAVLESGRGAELLRALRPVAFQWIADQTQNQPDSFGFIAQEVQEIMPELVFSSDDEDEILAIAGDALEAWMLLAFQDQQAVLTENIQADSDFGDRIDRLFDRWQNLQMGGLE